MKPNFLFLLVMLIVGSLAHSEELDKIDWLTEQDEGIQTCLKHRTTRDEIWVRKATQATYRCTGKKPITFSNPVDYSVRTFKGRIEILLKLQLNYSHYGQNQRNEATRQSLAIEKCVEDFYKRNGVDLRLDTITSTGAPAKLEPGRIMVKIVRDVFTSNALNWNGYTAQDLADGQAVGCGGMAHEVGHLLGLEDAYPVDYCPNRIIGPDDDIMNNSSSTSQLFPYEISQILRPLCRR